MKISGINFVLKRVYRTAWVGGALGLFAFPLVRTNLSRRGSSCRGDESPAYQQSTPKHLDPGRTFKGVSMHAAAAIAAALPQPMLLVLLPRVVKRLHPDSLTEADVCFLESCMLMIDDSAFRATLNSLSGAMWRWMASGDRAQPRLASSGSMPESLARQRLAAAMCRGSLFHNNDGSGALVQSAGAASAGSWLVSQSTDCAAKPICTDSLACLASAICVGTHASSAAVLDNPGDLQASVDFLVALAVQAGGSLSRVLLEDRWSNEGAQSRAVRSSGSGMGGGRSGKALQNVVRRHPLVLGCRIAAFHAVGGATHLRGLGDACPPTTMEQHRNLQRIMLHAASGLWSSADTCSQGADALARVMHAAALSSPALGPTRSSPLSRATHRSMLRQAAASTAVTATLLEAAVRMYQAEAAGTPVELRVNAATLAGAQPSASLAEDLATLGALVQGTLTRVGLYGGVHPQPKCDLLGRGSVHPSCGAIEADVEAGRMAACDAAARMLRAVGNLVPMAASPRQDYIAGGKRPALKVGSATEQSWLQDWRRAAIAGTELSARLLAGDPLRAHVTSLELTLRSSREIKGRENCKPVSSQSRAMLRPIRNLARVSKQFLVATATDGTTGELSHLLGCVAGLADRFLVDAASIAHDPTRASQRLLLTSTAQAIVEELALAQAQLDKAAGDGAPPTKTLSAWRFQNHDPVTRDDTVIAAIGLTEANSGLGRRSVVGARGSDSSLATTESDPRAAVQSNSTQQLEHEQGWLSGVLAGLRGGEDTTARNALSVRVGSQLGHAEAEIDASSHSHSGTNREEGAPAWSKVYRRLSKPLAQSIADEITELRLQLWRAADRLHGELGSAPAISAVAKSCAFATGEVPPVMLDSHNDELHPSFQVSQPQQQEKIAGIKPNAVGEGVPTDGWRKEARVAMGQTHALVEGSRRSLLASGALTSMLALACADTVPISLHTVQGALGKMSVSTGAVSNLPSQGSADFDPDSESDPSLVWTSMASRWRVNQELKQPTLSELQVQQQEEWESVQVSLVRSMANLALHEDKDALARQLAGDSSQEQGGGGQPVGLAGGQYSYSSELPARSLSALLVRLGETGNLRLRTQLARMVANVAAALPARGQQQPRDRRHPFPYSFPSSRRQPNAGNSMDISSSLPQQLPATVEKFGDMVHPLMDWRGREGSKRSVDVVLVHGLRGDPYLTWRAGLPQDAGVETIPGGAVVASQQEATGMEAAGSFVRTCSGGVVPVWPVAWLAPELFQKYGVGARVLSIGFDADPFARINRSRDASVPELAAQLEEQLEFAGVGRDGRPVVFLTHSLGGVLVKHILTRPWGILKGELASVSHSQASLASPVSVVFYGTPHKGSPVGYANILPIASPVVQHLHEGSNLLTDVDERFADACRLGKVGMPAVLAAKETCIDDSDESRVRRGFAGQDKRDGLANLEKGQPLRVDGPAQQTALSHSVLVGCGCGIEQLAEDIHVGMPSVVVVPERSAMLEQCRSRRVHTEHAYVCKPVRADDADPRYELATAAVNDILRASSVAANSKSGAVRWLSEAGDVDTGRTR